MYKLVQLVAEFPSFKKNQGLSRSLKFINKRELDYFRVGFKFQ